MRFVCCGCQAKIPDIEKCLDVVAALQAKKGTGEVRFCTVNVLSIRVIVSIINDIQWFSRIFFFDNYEVHLGCKVSW